MNLDSFIARQLKKPSGLVGRWMVGKKLNESNGPLEDMGLDLMQLQPAYQVLEIGFGNGRLISKMAEQLPEGGVMGIDISNAMIQQARKKNKIHIRNGRVNLVKASVARIPAEDDSYDRIFTANTIYFWPSPETNIREIWRTLKPGGKFYCALRIREDMLKMPVVRKSPRIFQNLYSRNEIVQFMVASGFSNVKLYEEQRPYYADVIVSGEK